MTSPRSHDDLIRTLLRTDAYPWNPPSVDLIETHISWVFLAGDRVVKVKRPVRYDFVDHTTLEQRRHSCEEEYRLNRRLTDNVYLGTVPLVRQGEVLVVSGDGEPYEWATLMRRLPADLMLHTLLASDTAPENLAGLLADRLIPFHRDTADICDPSGNGSWQAALEVVTSNLDELRVFAGGPFSAVQFELIETAMRAYIADHASLFEQRERDGWIRDGHGDLRAEHICVEDNTVQVFDCVEFSRPIRCADVASDLAFLLMDLSRLGAASIGRDLEGRYRRAGIDLPRALVRFYRAHRALVRAKIDCLTLRGGLRQHGELAAEAIEYLDTAARAALRLKPLLIAMTGLSGTGKSTVARAIARAVGAPLIASDDVRKTLAGVTGSAAADWGHGIYTEEWNQRTYERMFTDAAAELAAGRPVILDATFMSEDRREQAAAVARTASVPFLLVETVCAEEVARERIITRSSRGGSLSDADAAIQARQREMLAAGPIPIPSSATHITIDSTHESGSRLGPLYLHLHRANLISSDLTSGT